MNVLINGNPIIKSAGIGEYTRNLTNCLSFSEKCTAYLYFENEKPKTKPIENRVNFVIGKKSIDWDKYTIYHSADHFIPRIRNKNIRKIVTIHDLTNYINNDFFPWYKRIYKHIILKVSIKRAHHIIAVSSNTKKDIIKYLKVPEHSISIVYCGIDSVFRTVHTETVLDDMKKRYALPNRYILTVGTIEPRKNIINLVKAFQEIKDKNIHLLIIGKKGWSYKPIYSVIEASNKKEKIHILENIDSNEELAKIYQLASLFVFPSFYEGFGLPVIEAMASRIPVITSNVSSLPEIAKNGAHFINPHDYKSIAHSINEVLSTNNADIIDRAFIISQEFTWEKAVSQVLAIYNKLNRRCLP